MKRLLPLSLAILATGAMADTTVFYTYGDSYAEGGMAHPVAKHSFGISQTNKFALGVNSLSFTTLQSDINDPADGGKVGATEFVLNESFKWTLTDRLGLITGFEIGHKNTAGDPDTRKVFVGPTYALPLWGGTWTNTALVHVEWENCDSCKKPDESESKHHNGVFQPYLVGTTAYSHPFQFGTLPAVANASYTLKQKRGHSPSDGTPKLEQHGKVELLVSPVKGLWVGPGYVTKNTATSPAGGNGATWTLNAKYTF